MIISEIFWLCILVKFCFILIPLSFIYFDYILVSIKIACNGGETRLKQDYIDVEIVDGHEMNVHQSLEYAKAM